MQLQHCTVYMLSNISTMYTLNKIVKQCTHLVAVSAVLMHTFASDNTLGPAYLIHNSTTYPPWHNPTNISSVVLSCLVASVSIILHDLTQSTSLHSTCLNQLNLLLLSEGWLVPSPAILRYCSFLLFTQRKSTHPSHSTHYFYLTLLHTQSFHRPSLATINQTTSYITYHSF